MPRKSVKNAILEAAFEIIENGSSSQLTVDAVINRAGVSKGGFFHHFESKEALLKAMVDWWLKSFEQDLPSVAVTKKNASKKDFDAYIAHGFSGGGARFRSGVVVLAIAAHHPQLMQPIKAYFRKRAAAVQASSANPAAALAAMSLADGLWIMDALGIPPISGRQRKQVEQEIRSWVQKSA